MSSKDAMEGILQNADLPEISDESVLNVQHREGTVRIGRRDRTAFNPAPDRKPELDYYAASVHR